MLLRRDLVHEGANEPALADAGLAGQHDDIAVSSPCLDPALAKHGEFLRPIDKSAGVSRTWTSAARLVRLGLDAIDAQFLRDALEPPWPETDAAEMRRHQLERRAAYQDRVRRGELFQPRRDVWRLADDAVPFARLTSAELADDDQAGMNPDMGPQRRLDG